jgi:hypothetical protein
MPEDLPPPIDVKDLAVKNRMAGVQNYRPTARRRISWQGVF